MKHYKIVSGYLNSKTKLYNQIHIFNVKQLHQ